MPTIIDKLAWIYLVNKHILSTRSRGKDVYYIPGGKREKDETDQEALIREIKEELDVDVLPETLTFFGIFEAQAHGQTEGAMVRMTCYTAQFTGTIRASSEIEEVAWLSYDDKEKSSPVDQLIFAYLRDKGLLE